MIALWMLYAMLVACGFTLAGLVAERALRSLGWSVRFVWAAVLLLSAAVPVGTVLSGEESATTSATLRASAASEQTAIWVTMLDRSLLYGWLVVVVLLAISAVVAMRSLLRARRHWRAVDVQGGRVLVSRDFGPGVVALGRAQIVVPAWALELETSVMELLLRHEREHLRARDHWVVLGALVMLLLCPFNLVLWWQFHRLKLAIEMDCDARVLSGRQDVRAYTALLLDVGERCRAARLVFAAFSSPPHAIERRIRVLLDRRKERRRLGGALTAAGAVVIGILACQTPDPGSPEDAVRSALGVQNEIAPPPPHDGEYGAAQQRSENVLLAEERQCVRKSGGTEVEKAVDCEVIVTTRGGVKMISLHPRGELPPPPPPPPPPVGGENEVYAAQARFAVEGQFYAVAGTHGDVKLLNMEKGTHYHFTASQIKLDGGELVARNVRLRF
ncbi:MAG: M56 family metallopeptidase [Longimicrobiales bacterium]